ncbi:hypothetical protein BGX27_001789 [Mortierella sp. AM989]|nr:hypothetical protein BGX27_001789 [Mortierella sp. AM989]
MSSTKTHPLLLPELVSFLSYNVEPEDLHSCSLVCKTWHTEFNPLVWSTIVIYNQYGPPRVLIQDIAAHIYHIRKLVYTESVPPEYMSIRCPNLETLKIIDKDWTMSESSWLNVGGIIRESPKLIAIRILANNRELSEKLWDAIGGSMSVKVLQLDKVNIPFAHSWSFWRACTNLEKLEMDGCKVINPWTSLDYFKPLPASFPTLQEIKFSGDLRGIGSLQQLQLAVMCPKLQSLCWIATQFSREEEQLEPEQFAGKSIMNLDSLEMREVGQYKDVEYFLTRSEKALKKLVVSGSTYGFPGFKNLERHFSTLQELDFKNFHLRSKAIATLLYSCPFLTIFKAGTVRASDIRRGETWACADRLSTLLIFFDLEEGNPEVTSRRVFACLAKLTLLQELDLNKNRKATHEFGGDVEPLRLQLDSGMDQLSTLKCLKRFYFGDYGHKMSMKEGKWIKNNWKMLEIIHGRFNSDPHHSDRQLTNLFNKEIKRFSRRQLRD